MLKTRIVTALVLLAVLLAILYSGSLVLFKLAATAFLAAAGWECFRLFRNPMLTFGAGLWAFAFVWVVFRTDPGAWSILFAICAVIWLIRLAPSLGLGLPPIESFGNRLLLSVYGISIFGCFLAIVALYSLHGAIYLLSAMAIVWIADIGAYFAGRAFGKRKLAPSISPGKSWEGVFGGWIAVLLLAGLAAAFLPYANLPAAVLQKWGWIGFAAAMTLLTAASVVGDLFESMLKRRAGMKDSSNLLPGHGGVLDRIDALIPVLPLAALFDTLQKL